MAQRLCAFPLLLAALALPAAAWADDGVSALIGGGPAYNNIHGGGKASYAHQYTLHGAALFTFDDPGFGVQLEGGNDWFTDAGQTNNLWSAGADVFWRDNKGTIGLSASFSTIDGRTPPFFTTKKAFESYGMFGEYYVLDDLTLQIKGGGTTGPIGSTSLYGGGGLTFYDGADLAFHSEINFTAYTSGRDWADIDSSIEYLPFARLPMSLYAGYDFANVSAAGYVSTFFVGLKFRIGPGRALVSYQRSGPVEWTGNAMPGANIRF